MEGLNRGDRLEECRVTGSEWTQWPVMAVVVKNRSVQDGTTATTGILPAYQLQLNCSLTFSGAYVPKTSNPSFISISSYPNSTIDIDVAVAVCVFGPQLCC